MIIDCKNVVSFLKVWLTDKLLFHKKDGFAVVLTGGVDSTICATLCFEMAHNSRVLMLLSGFDDILEKKFVEWAAKTYPGVGQEVVSGMSGIVPEFARKDDARTFWLPSCMSALSSRKNLLSVGAVTRSEYSLLKMKGVVDFDCYPFVDLYRSEMLQFLPFFKIPNDMCRQSKMEKDLDVTFDELEWVDRENMSTNVISSNVPPTMSRFWGSYDIRKKQLTSRIYSLSKTVGRSCLPEDKICPLRKTLPGILS